MLTKSRTTSTRAPITGWRAWLSGRPLVREIGLVLIVKIVLLAALWYAFFRDAPTPEPARLFAHVPLHFQETTR